MGKQVSLHPVVVALAVLSGTVLAGILGAVIAVPLVAVAWTVFSTLRGDNPVPIPLGVIRPTIPLPAPDNGARPPAEEEQRP
jgi:predicted PurR-regulated permease PerM